LFQKGAREKMLLIKYCFKGPLELYWDVRLA
jgi:hypothetical protein